MQSSLSSNPERHQANSNGDEDEEQKQEQNGVYRDQLLLPSGQRSELSSREEEAEHE